ncbi:MAG: cyclic nucleotide-binding domain-containing protein [Chlamydiales bacterium]
MKRLTLIDKAFLLKRTSLFNTIDLDLLLAFADKLISINLKKGEIIFPLGQEAHRMFFVGQGSVEILDSAGNILETLQSPDFFGEESLFTDLPRTYAAKAQTDVQLLSLTQAHLNMILSEVPAVVLRLISIYAALLPHQHRFYQEGSHDA